MLLTALTPAKSLDRIYAIQPVNREHIDRFKTSYRKLLALINEKESEENLKDHLMDFLKEVYYKDAYVVAPKGKTDFVIHLGKDANTPAGVLFEVKRPANKSEMVTRKNLNVKAFHELLLYYFQERQRAKNSDIRHCIITNIYEWFIFDASLIDRLFYRNTYLIREYKSWSSGQKVSKNNDLFYNEIIKPFITDLIEEIPFTYFNLLEFQKFVIDDDKDNDKALLSLYKILSPTHLLKLPTATDSNQLNPKFYSELLHLIGLEEVKEGSKKVIRRKEVGKRNEGSLLENTIIELDTANKLSHLSDLVIHGATNDEQLFSVALELCITWINRILFLKLLESQLVKYHSGSQDYAFLNRTNIADFDELYKLFFRVLAKKSSERQFSIQAKFSRIPYLNSSLFEITELEDATININGLDDGLSLPIFPKSVLLNNPAYHHVKELDTLSYLFAFLESYDFASESWEGIQEKDRTLINASVLGLIFEKINGYKDGSFYTPGFITEYMCRETVRKAVVQKFNNVKGWNCKDFADLEDKELDKIEANTIINELRICDPAVGSGHFLVSALNELIAIKSDLKVLQDASGKRLKGYSVEIFNDELLIHDEDGEPFSYVLQSNAKPTVERQRIQKTLFYEKQTIIENCLFGVDINPNSVKICRLRLWIELLKNAYYTSESDFKELETLPNIDINIKQGNSLLSKFSLTEDLTDVFQRHKFSLKAYKNAVASYKEVKTKDAKVELLAFINEIKSQFFETVYKRDPRRKKLADLRGQRILLDNNVDLFGKAIRDESFVAVEKIRIEKYIKQIEAEILDIETNVLYRGSFEWRFEFPEVLNEKGDFTGFDAIIGNPPYGIKFNENIKIYLKKNYDTIIGKYDSYGFFVERGINILNDQGFLGYIIPHTWLTVVEALGFRQFLIDNTKILEIDKLPSKVFEDAVVEATNMIIKKCLNKEEREINQVKVLYFKNDETITSISFINATSRLYLQEKWNNVPAFNINIAIENQEIHTKINRKSIPLNSVCDFSVGVQAYDSHTGQDTSVIKNRIYHADKPINETFVKEVNGKDMLRFGLNWPGNTWISYGEWLAHPRKKSFFDCPRILIREITAKGKHSIIGCYTEDYYINYKSILNIKALDGSQTTKQDLKFFLGLINSSLYSWYFSQFANKAITNTFPRISLFDLKKFPIKNEILFTNIQHSLKQKIISSVELAHEMVYHSRDISVLETEIDWLVYNLYELTAEEIAIIERKAD